MEKRTASQRDEAPGPEIRVTVHYADKGPSLGACMVSLLNARRSKAEESCR